MELTTARADLRPWRHDEAERLFDIRRRPDVVRWLSDSTPWSDLRIAQERIAEWGRRAGSPDGLGVWAIVPRATGVPAGTVRLHRLPGGDDVGIAWYLHPDSTGCGLATEAAQAVLAHGFSWSLPRIWALMWPDNHASARVCEAIGMTDRGVIADPWYGDTISPTARIFRADRDARSTGVDPPAGNPDRRSC